MQIGWIDFSKTDRDRVVSVLNSLSEDGVLDELGIAKIRDGFSNLFFPGITTIQTRAKYFLIVPYALRDLEKNSTKDFSILKKELKNKEYSCAEKLLPEKKDQSETGIIGSSSFDRENWIQRTPSSIYWAGIKTFGIFNEDISLNQYLKTISSIKNHKENISRSRNYNDKYGEVHDDKDAGNIHNINFWNIHPLYKDDWFENLEINLTKDEGDFLKKRIIGSCPNSMLEFFLKNNREDILNYDSFSDLKDIADEFPPDLRNSFWLAKCFSDFNRVLIILFNNMINNGDIEEANEKFKEEGLVPKEIAKIDFECIFKKFLKKRDMKLKCFLLESQKLMKEENFDELKVLIKNREISLKGESRSKICHPEKFNNKGLVDQGLNYRFDIARDIIEDIFKSGAD